MTTCERCGRSIPIVEQQAPETCEACRVVELEAEVERLRARFPNPDDMRLVCDRAWGAALNRGDEQVIRHVRATMEEADGR